MNPKTELFLPPLDPPSAFRDQERCNVRPLTTRDTMQQNAGEEKKWKLPNKVKIGRKWTVMRNYDY